MCCHIDEDDFLISFFVYLHMFSGVAGIKLSGEAYDSGDCL